MNLRPAAELSGGGGRSRGGEARARLVVAGGPELSRGVLFARSPGRWSGRAQGYEDAQLEPPAGLSEPPDEDGAPDWVMILPRPRNVFWTVCLFALGRDAQPVRSGHLVPTLTERTIG